MSSFFPTRAGIEADDPHRRGCGCRACTRDLVAGLAPAERAAIAAAPARRSARPVFVNGPSGPADMVAGRALAARVARRLGRPAETVDDLTPAERREWEQLPNAARDAMFAATIDAKRRGKELEFNARNVGRRPRPERAVRARR